MDRNCAESPAFAFAIPIHRNLAVPTVARYAAISRALISPPRACIAANGVVPEEKPVKSGESGEFYLEKTVMPADTDYVRVFIFSFSYAEIHIALTYLINRAAPCGMEVT